MENRVYMCIDLKSFFASVECRERGLDPLTTNLVVADNARTEKTICLAITPSLKAYGLPGRARLFEVIQKVSGINIDRKRRAPGHKFIGKSYDANELNKNPKLELDYIVATPRMAYYVKYSTEIYNIYLKYISEEDIIIYSIDEVFCDITKYLKLYNLSPRELATKIIKDVYETTGITATAGIGTNMFLSKVAMDVVAKKCKPNEFGVRIAELDEISFRRTLWEHRPITDIWRVGKGYAKRLEKFNIYTMGDVAKCSVRNEELLYKLFGKNAELLIDHSWGWEPTIIETVKAYRPETKSISNGQVLHCPYEYDKARLILKEMAELISLELVNKGFVTDQLVLHIGYDIENLKDPKISRMYEGDIVENHYGKRVPKPAHGTYRLTFKTASTKLIVDGFLKLFDKYVDKNLLVRRVNIATANLSYETEADKKQNSFEQLDLFTDYKKVEKQRAQEEKKLKQEKQLQKVMLELKEKFGKNAIIKGMNLEEGGTTIDRNKQIGGHKE